MTFYRMHLAPSICAVSICDISKSTFTHMVSDAADAAALMPTAFGRWPWEVELDVLLHQEGTVVVRAGQEATLAVV